MSVQPLRPVPTPGLKRGNRQLLRGGVAAVVVALALFGGFVQAPSAGARPVPSPASPSTGSLRWSSCPDASGFQCATIRVPRDYDAPGGPQISVAAIRHPATDPSRRIGSMFWNPGGPGGAGTDSLPLFWSSFPQTIRERYDVVSFDPRGVGRSTPLQCFDTPAQEQRLLARLPVGFPVGRSEQRRQIRVQAAFDAACAERGGQIQRHMSTANVARDMDRLRAAVGDARLTYWGTSYGTYLGVTYANLFPAHAGRIILDGNVPPVQWNDAAHRKADNTFTRLQSPLGSETGLTLMLQQCGAAGASRCAFAATTPEKTVAKYRILLRRLRAHPGSVSGVPFTYAATVSQTASLLIAQNRNPVTNTGWTDLADLLQVLWRQSDPSTTTQPPVPQKIADLVTGKNRPPSAVLPEATPGVLCSESPNPTRAKSYVRQANAANRTQSPDGFGALWTWLAEPCASWQAGDADRYTGPWDRATVPFLVIGTVADSNTAFVGSQLMAAELPNARLLTEGGGGHTALLNRSTCIDDRAVAYLVSGRLPAPGTFCEQDQHPF